MRVGGKEGCRFDMWHRSKIKLSMACSFTPASFCGWKQVNWVNRAKEGFIRCKNKPNQVKWQSKSERFPKLHLAAPDWNLEDGGKSAEDERLNPSGLRGGGVLTTLPPDHSNGTTTMLTHHSTRGCDMFIILIFRLRENHLVWINLSCTVEVLLLFLRWCDLW